MRQETNDRCELTDMNFGKIDQHHTEDQLEHIKQSIEWLQHQMQFVLD